MSYGKMLPWALVSLSIILAAQEIQAFALRPTGTDDERIIVQLKSPFWGRFEARITEFLVDHFTVGVHEEMTHRIWGCRPPENAKPDDKTCMSFRPTPAAVIYGVQWNDNPPFKLDSTTERSCTLKEPIRLPDRQPECWRVLFYDAALHAADPNVYYRQANEKALVYRSHFGDLQFLHSMASWNGETMGQTKTQILMWAEFTYKVATQNIGPKTPVSAVKNIKGFEQVLGRYWSDVGGLFTFGVNEYSNQIPDVAFGSLLHMVQDSFSRSHVWRDAPAGVCDAKEGAPKAGQVRAFYAYNSQNPNEHGKRDARNWMLGDLRDEKGGDAVSVGQTLRALRDAAAPWELVREYLDHCVYGVADTDLGNPAGPGEFSK